MFATPLWLAALATLLIPLALHLWSRRPRQLIRVGTLRHLDHLPEPRSRSARLTEPLLLLLRLGILAVIAVALAGPRLAGPPLARPDRLVLVEPALLGDPLLDSLESAGTTVRLIAPGLPEVRLPHRGDSSTISLPIWEALRQADGLVAPEGAIELYARPRVVALGDIRPAIRSTVHWHAPPPPMSRRWNADLSRISPDSVQVVVGEGDGEGVVYRRVRARDGGVLSLSSTEVPRTPVVHRLGLAPLDSAGARRAALAVRAVAEELGQPVTLAATDADTTLALAPWLLAGDDLADTLLARWPWQPTRMERDDPRLVSLTTALPRAAIGARESRAEPRTVEFLLLAALLLVIERLVASRPRRSAP